jgi:hypothetical protein
MRDEYNAPTDAWNGMLGAQSRSWKPAGDLTGWGEPIKVDDWRRPIFARETALARGQGPATGPYQAAYGAGRVCVVPRAVGKDYMDGAREVEGKLVNGAPVGTYTGGNSSALCRSAILGSSYYESRIIRFPAVQLHPGSNTLPPLRLNQGSVMYDMLKLEVDDPTLPRQR